MVFEPDVAKDIRLADAVHGLTAPHISSFNHMLDFGLKAVVKHITPIRMLNTTNNKQTITISVEQIEIDKPVHSFDSTLPLYPYQARISKTDYSGQLSITYMVQVDDNSPVPYVYKNSSVPVMVGSTRCYLNGLSPTQLVAVKEEPHEAGGYFIAKGSEKVCRLLIANIKNYPLCIERQNWAKRFTQCTEKGAMIRSVREDGTFETNVVHYCKDGTTSMSFGSLEVLNLSTILVLKALKHTTDRDLFLRILEPRDIRTRINVDRVLTMLSHLRTLYPEKHTREHFLEIISHSQRRTADHNVLTSAKIGQAVIDRDLLVHLGTNNDAKFDLIIFMIQKVLRFVDGKINADDPDVFGLQECQTPGQTYLTVLKHGINIAMGSIRKRIDTELYMAAQKNTTIDFSEEGFANNFIRQSHATIAPIVRAFISTGSVSVPTMTRYMNDQRPILTQYNGLTVMADKINYFRFISHFRSIHRGAFWMDSRVTDVRKLRPDQFGFICPVHTPDGAPCGLLNHLTHVCRIHCPNIDSNTERAAELALIEVLLSLGMRLNDHHRYTQVSGDKDDKTEDMRSVLLNGAVVGVVPAENMHSLAKRLRHLKVTQTDSKKRVPSHLEIVILPTEMGGTMYLATSAYRFQRPVKSLATGDIEWVGALEQIFMNIALTMEHVKNGTTHMEIEPTNMLSNVGNLTPFSDFNQSPRNVYQCQMAKQTMGFPLFSYPFRTDNKIYRLQTPQKALSRTRHQENIPADDYPLGTNAVVAVISYTGYDMEDAMIVNKSSYDRGLGQASVYKTQVVDLLEHDPLKQQHKGGRMQARESHAIEALKQRKEPPMFFDNLRTTAEKFGSQATTKKTDELIVPSLGPDGLPPIGLRLREGDPILCIFDETTGKHKQINWKTHEEGYVDNIKILGFTDIAQYEGTSRVTSVIITFRIPRNPTIGDKFSSRHGQKGIMSMLWPQEDMPFTDSGMTPDIIINPHAFPSRMTIGMLVESMASKAGALHGFFPDATPFQFDEKDNRAIDYFGQMLSKAGFNYYGNEQMYSGTLGQEMKADIFLGVVYYQRLRHMVSDKFQVRAKGPIDRLTRQPVKGRKKGGGVRFGEMERDGLLAYGASFVVRDRLLHCSDEDYAHVCTKCGNMLSTILRRSGSHDDYVCKTCKSGKYLQVITIPYVLRYLANELAAMNISMCLSLST
jgi:DNA-directed RNA polymerase I subunit RPA2